MMILFPFILCRSYEALIGTVSHDTFDWLSDKQSRSEGVESGVGNRGSGTGGILTGPPGEIHIPIFTLFRDFKPPLLLFYVLRLFRNTTRLANAPSTKVLNKMLSFEYGFL